MDHQSRSNLGTASQSVILSYLDPIRLIEQTTWYSIKFKDSMTGYKRLVARYGDQLQVRFTKDHMPATILLTDTEGFFEPYLNINLQERLQIAMLTFEVQFNSSSHLYRHSMTFFELMWNRSETYDEFVTREEDHKKEPIIRLKRHVDPPFTSQ
jgi:hypothetical protein